MPKTIVAVAGGTLGTVTLNATARTRMNFAVPQILAAAQLARGVHATEAANRDLGFGSFWDDLFGSSLACIILSTASLESYANEIFADRSQHFSERDQGLVDLLWREFEPKALLDKFDLSLRLRSSPVLDRGSCIVQSIDRLVKLRNAVVHFKPEWFDEADAHEKLSRQLHGYAVHSPWLKTEALFPRAWASAGTVAWVIETVIKFIDHFSATASLPNKFEKFKDRLTVVS